MIQRLRSFGFGVQGMGKLNGSSLVDAMAAFITQHEGYNPNFAGNNNPGNLIYVKGGWNYPGAQPGAGGFAAYPDTATGQAALAHQIQVQVNNGQDLTQFFNQYAPGNTKNAAGGVQTPQATQAYIDQASTALGIPVDVPLNQVQAGTYDASSYTTYTNPDPSIMPVDTSSDPTSVDFTSTDPTVYVIGGAVALGVLYVLFGH